MRAPHALDCIPVKRSIGAFVYERRDVPSGPDVGELIPVPDGGLAESGSPRNLDRSRRHGGPGENKEQRNQE